MPSLYRAWRMQQCLYIVNQRMKQGFESRFAKYQLHTRPVLSILSTSNDSHHGHAVAHGRLSIDGIQSAYQCPSNIPFPDMDNQLTYPFRETFSQPSQSRK